MSVDLSVVLKIDSFCRGARPLSVVAAIYFYGLTKSRTVVSCLFLLFMLSETLVSRLLSGKICEARKILMISAVLRASGYVLLVAAGVFSSFATLSFAVVVCGASAGTGEAAFETFAGGAAQRVKQKQKFLSQMEMMRQIGLLTALCAAMFLLCLFPIRFVPLIGAVFAFTSAFCACGYSGKILLPTEDFRQEREAVRYIFRNGSAGEWFSRMANAAFIRAEKAVAGLFFQLFLPVFAVNGAALFSVFCRAAGYAVTVGKGKGGDFAAFRALIKVAAIVVNGFSAPFVFAASALADGGADKKDRLKWGALPPYQRAVVAQAFSPVEKIGAAGLILAFGCCADLLGVFPAFLLLTAGEAVSALAIRYCDSK